MKGHEKRRNGDRGHPARHVRGRVEGLVLEWSSPKTCKDALIEYGLDADLGCGELVDNGNELRLHFYHSLSDKEDFSEVPLLQ